MIETPPTLLRCPTWRLTRRHLIDFAGGRLWGRWDRVFGCWDRTGRPVAPLGPLFNRLGVWFDPPGPRDEAWYASRRAVAAYWSLIPTPIRLFAACADDQWLTLAGLWGRQPDHRRGAFDPWV